MDSKQVKLCNKTNIKSHRTPGYASSITSFTKAKTPKIVPLKNP